MGGLDAYRQQSSITEDPKVLILKLYEGLTRFLSDVKVAIEEDDIEKKFDKINRAIAVFDELRLSLNFEGGEIAHYLDGLYLYQIETLFEIGISNDLKKLDQVCKVSHGLTEAWRDEISKD